MRTVAAGLALIVLAIGAYAGWHARTARGAHADIKTNRGRIPGWRRTRLRSSLIALGLVVAALLLIRTLLV